MSGWIVALYILYAIGVCVAAYLKSNAHILWLLLAPTVLGLVFIVAAVWLFGSAATEAVRSETGMRADGTKAFPYYTKDT
ncbi:hypothetical protein ACFW6V_25785 [Streptomyces sp. NPDC058734]|uniref:hypothetical protein n=1 Tax=Streptomyces sp. NPDC058734 TaxID=3346615 RepID=UPI0036933C2E